MTLTTLPASPPPLAFESPATLHAIQLNAFFQGRAAVPEPLGRCPGCEAARPWRPFMLVHGAIGSEGEGVVLPSVRCPRCTLVFLSPRLPARHVAAFYRASARLAPYFATGAKARRDRGAGFLPFARLVGRTVAPDERDLLDLGCGAGAFLRVMASRGFRVTGADLNPEASALARAEGLDVRTADLDEAVAAFAREGRRFDVVTLIHTFEHLAEPLRTLRSLRAILRDDGAVAINVPNVRSFLAPLDRALGTGYASIWDPVGHYSYFSLRSLRHLCARAGFRVVAQTSRLFVSGRPGLLGLLDDAASALCARFGGIGSNVTIVARKQLLIEDDLGAREASVRDR
jgi:2-polyprenyl-3-methyl-5-hydroxy-6-metoxy-1,4-benzoquinol methylase